MERLNFLRVLRVPRLQTVHHEAVLFLQVLQLPLMAGREFSVQWKRLDGQERGDIRFDTSIFRDVG